jgi:Insecticide toxin TcdB middle/C-terminal region/Insecticide toxin TcdB middle/N-terminal region
VHVVERVETYDRISRNRFVTRYAYHHGYFDGEEREFRGFGMVEQFDTEEFAAPSASDAFPVGDNIDQTSHVPPVLTRTWFHTGAYIEGGRMSRQFENDYYREGDPSLGEAGLSDDRWRAMLLDDTRLPESVLLPDGIYRVTVLSPDEAREACRGLKGSFLRQEIYAQDGTEAQDRPYSVSERNYTLEWLQPREGQRHAVFFAHPRETLDFHYERKLFDVDVGGQGKRLADPRVSHAMTLAVDYFGNVLQSVAIGYGRRHDDPDPVLTDADRSKQEQPLITYTENRFTEPVEEQDDSRTPLPCETRTYELLNVRPDAIEPLVTNLFRLEEMRDKIRAAGDTRPEIPYEDVYATGVRGDAPHRRPIEHMRSLFRRNDLTGPLPLGGLQSVALPYEQYRLAFTQGLAEQIYVDSGKLSVTALNAVLADEGKYVHSEGDAGWWIPSGWVFYAPGGMDTSAELAYARQHFFLPHRYRDPFHTDAISTESVVTYDVYDLLPAETRDALGNRVTVGERDAAGNPVTPGNDYRVLQPRLMMDPNRNRTAVAFDALGMVEGTAVMGKPLPALVEGDSLDGFEADLSEAVTLDRLANPMADPQAILTRATTRLVYDLCLPAHQIPARPAARRRLYPGPRDPRQRSCSGGRIEDSA